MNAVLPNNAEAVASPETLLIRQTVVALGLNTADDTTLRFFSALAGYVPVNAAFFLHVQPRFDLLGALFEREAQSVVSNFDLHTDLVRQLEHNVYRHFAPQGPLRVEIDVREGNPLEEILRQSADLQADLLIAGKNSHGATHGILSGNLVRKSKCNTLIVPDQARSRLKRILVPVDFSPYSVRALQTAAALAATAPESTEIVVSHAYDLPSIMAYRINKTEEELQTIIENDRRAALEDFLGNFAPQLSDRCRFELIRHQETSIPELIMDMASAQEADLIVMGAKGHSKVELLLMGSVTESLLQMNNTIPVWVVK